ncbi:C4-dicarboxylate TRAP transporter large permease protein DctM [subsurface metagenome]
MSLFAAKGGIAKMAYDTVYKWFYKLPGSLAIATTISCAIFGAISGSSMATSAVFGRVSYPIMRQYNYSKRLALGSIAASGTFACMIPPSTLLVFYAIITETSVGSLFMAGIIPGLLTALAYTISIIIRVKLNPNLAPIKDKEAYTFKQKILSIKNIFPIGIIIVFVLGGIYSGILTVTEGAATGCLLTFFIGCIKSGWNKMNLRESLVDSAKTTVMVFFIIIGSFIFARFIGITRIPFYFSKWIISLSFSSEIIILLICVMFFLLGMIMSPVGIMAITLPVVMPVVRELGYNPIWFGIIVMKLMEIAAVTPPFGLNVFVLKGVLGREERIEEIFYGIWPFVIMDLIVLIPLIYFPSSIA